MISRTKKALSQEIEGRYPPTPELLALADQALNLMWRERLDEQNRQPTQDRSYSCKFAALMARELFGGRLAGNFFHVFVIRAGSILDLNHQQSDVLALGDKAHEVWPKHAFFREYVPAFVSCIPRVERWVWWFEERVAEMAPATGARHCAPGFTPYGELNLAKPTQPEALS